MPAQQAPRNGIWYGWDTGESGAGARMNANLLKIDALIQIAALTIGATTAPTTPDDGDTHIVGVGATGVWSDRDDHIAVWRDDLSAWEFYAPQLAWVAGVLATETLYMFTATGWKDFPSIVLDADLVAIAALTGTGLARRTGTNAWDLFTPGTAASANVTTAPTGNPSGSVWRTNDLVKQTSRTDAVEGRVMLVGAGGLLSGAMSGVDWQGDTIPCGFYSGSTNSPVSGQNVWGVASSSNDYTATTFFAGRGTRFFARSKIGGVWAALCEFYHDQNTSADVKAMLGAANNAAIRTAIDSSVFPSYTLATMPSAAANTNKGIIVTDLTGGREPCWSDGANWRRASDRSIAA